MPSGPEADVHSFLTQEVIRAHDVVDGGDLMVDMLDPMARRGEEGDLVMDLVNSQQRRLADPVADLRPAGPRPELLITRRRIGVQPNMGEPCNPCQPCLVKLPPAMP